MSEKQWNILIRDAFLVQCSQYIDVAIRAEDEGRPEVAKECITWAQERLEDWRKSVGASLHRQ